MNNYVWTINLKESKAFQSIETQVGPIQKARKDLAMATPSPKLGSAQTRRDFFLKRKVNKRHPSSGVIITRESCSPARLSPSLRNWLEFSEQHCSKKNPHGALLSVAQAATALCCLNTKAALEFGPL
jgi:hypothetical protein